MPSKLKKAIGAVKDRTSISIAKVGGGVNSSAANLKVLILKATSHDDTPMDQRYVYEILHLVASNKSYAATCARAFSRRIGKTRSWNVVLKSLMLVLRIFQDGDPFFPGEVLHTMKRGGKILNLSSFLDSSHSTLRDFTAYVRMFALYLDDRLDCILKGKLQKRVAFRKRENEQLPSTVARDMKPSMLLDRISYWQRLLDRAIVMRPTGAAKDNSLVRLSLYSIIQESFDLYRDISDGIASLLDSFFHLQYESCVSAFQTFVKTSEQFVELSSYYAFCKSLGIGRRSEYPSVHKISDELIETLRKFLKDQASFPMHPQSAVPSPPNPRCSSLMSSDHFESCVNFETSEPIDRLSEKASEQTSRCTSLEDLMFMTDAGTSPSFTFNGDSFEGIDAHSVLEGSNGSNSTYSSPSTTTTMDTFPRVKNRDADFISVDKWPSPCQAYPNQGTSNLNVCWELELAETSSQLQSNPDVVDLDTFGDTSMQTRSLQTNPFLQEEVTLVPSGRSSNEDFDFFHAAPTFLAMPMPTFSVRNPNAVLGRDDPFATSLDGGSESSNKQRLFHEQQLWLRNQIKIIERHDLGLTNDMLMKRFDH